MCGIVGYTGNEPAIDFLLDGLARLEYRGYDSAGVAVLNGGNIAVEKTVERIGSLKRQTRNGRSLPGRAGIGHTRWATHGAPSLANAHPHLSADGRFAVVHNGILENDAALRRELAAEGVAFRSETDTEIIPHLIRRYYEGDPVAAVAKAVERLAGSYALGVLCADCPDRLIAARRFSPLLIGLADGATYLASDVTALLPRTRRVLELADGEIALLTPQGARLFDREGRPVEREASRVTFDVGAAEKGGWAHFMQKEIMEQPQAVAQTVERRISGGEIVFSGLRLDAALLSRIRRIAIVACGSAYHAGAVGKYVFEELLRIPTELDLASEFRYRNPLVGADVLTVVISQSGETADTLAALREAKARGSHVLSIVNVVGSSIARASDDVLYTFAGPEIAVATTKGYSTQLALLYLFAVWAARLLGRLSADEAGRLLDAIRALPQAMERALRLAPQMEDLASRSPTDGSIFFIGRNLDYAVAQEAALKLKEISYLPAQACAGGELKHGSISLIEEGRTVIALDCCDRLSDKLAGNIREVQARGARVIACVPEGRAEPSAADETVRVPAVHPLLTASVEVIPFQLYAYFVARDRGCDVDKPRNLAKSVTVE